MIKIDYDKCCWKDGKCTQCSCKGLCVGCVEACKFGALERKDKLEFYPDKCTNCGACIAACEHDAIKMI